MTRLDPAQLEELVARVHAHSGGFSTCGRHAVLGLYKSVALVVFLLRENPTQQLAGAVFGSSQATVPRRFTLPHQVIGDVLADLLPDPVAAAGGSTVLIDGTLARTWDWKARGDLYSGKHRDTGFNLQVATTLAGDLLAVSAPIPGSHHDAHAFTASGLAADLTSVGLLGNLGYLGTDTLTGTRTPPKAELSGDRKQANTDLSALRAAVERTISWLKNWKSIGGRC
ncbi:hypothetical protein BH24ACT15_BH24ACT15_22950 [soil metagenome]